MYRWNIHKALLLTLCGALITTTATSAQTDSLLLTVDRLFELGTQHSLQLQADAMKAETANEQTRAARSDRLPDLQIGLKAGVLGQPVVWQQGLTHPTRPNSPDWSQNYVVDLVQPIYQGGKIQGTIKKADIEKQLVRWQTATDRAEVKLRLLNQYLNLFTLYKQYEILERNIEESIRRLHDIRRLKEEGVITNNDVLRSEMQLTNDRLSLQETANSITLVSQQLDIWLGQDERLLLIPDTALLHQAVALQTNEEYVAQAYNNDPEMMIRYTQTELARNDIRLTQAASLPSLSFYASNTLARPVSRTLADRYNNNWNAGLSLSYTPSSLFKSNHRIKEKKLTVQLYQNAEEQQQQHLRIEVRTAYLRHSEALQRVEALKLSERQAAENYRIMQNRYLNQLTILTDLLDANTVRLNIELQLITAQTRVVYTYYQLMKVCGAL